ncbi:MAG: efflux RND transporter permease subunit, partial [Anaerovoracaceae bacterium]
VSTAQVAENIQAKFIQLEEKYTGLQFTTLSDQGKYIELVIDSVLQNLILGGVLAILILLFFLRDIKPTLITAVSIPISVTFAIALMYF